MVPPPVNASNLNDISNALQAVNITQQERTVLGAQANNTLGQVLEALKSVVDGDISDVKSTIATIQSTLNQKGNTNSYVSSYIGNGQRSLTLQLEFEPKFIFFLSEDFQMDERRNTYLAMVYVYNSPKTITFVSSTSINRVSFSGTTINISAPSYPEQILNESGTTVCYIVFG